MNQQHPNNQHGLDSQGFPLEPKKKHTGLKIAAGIFGFLVVIGVASSLSDANDPSPNVTIPNVVTTTNPPATTAPAAPEVTTEAPAEPETTEPEAPSMTNSQEQAVRSAEQYLSVMSFSRKGLIRQLSSSAGAGFSTKDATFAVDYLTVDWNEQAAKSAKEYLSVTSFSRAGLIRQLESSAGAGFTHAQAVYGVNKAGL
jgi:hypothetical protein